MSKLTKEQAVSFGGNVWAKEGKELRVYLNADAIVKMADGYKVSELDLNAMKKAKTYLDIATNELKSDIGTVRSFLNQIGFSCVK